MPAVGSRNASGGQPIHRSTATLQKEPVAPTGRLPWDAPALNTANRGRGPTGLLRHLTGAHDIFILASLEDVPRTMPDKNRHRRLSRGAENATFVSLDEISSATQLLGSSPGSPTSIEPIQAFRRASWFGGFDESQLSYYQTIKRTCGQSGRWVCPAKRPLAIGPRFATGDHGAGGSSSVPNPRRMFPRYDPNKPGKRPVARHYRGLPRCWSSQSPGTSFATQDDPQGGRRQGSPPPVLVEYRQGNRG